MTRRSALTWPIRPRLTPLWIVVYGTSSSRVASSRADQLAGVVQHPGGRRARSDVGTASRLPAENASVTPVPGVREEASGYSK